MMTSLFSNEFRDILMFSIDKYYLSNSGYKTYDYMEDNIRPLIEQYRSNKDSYRLIKAGTINTINEEVNIWFVGYYNWTDKIIRYNATYVGKSLCLAEVKGSETQLVDKVNLLFDTFDIALFREDEKFIEDVYNYWSTIILNILERTNFKCISEKYKDSIMYGVKIKNILEYIDLVIAYHLYRVICNYSNTESDKWIKSNIILNDIQFKFNKYFESRDDLHNFCEKVMKYK